MKINKEADIVRLILPVTLKLGHRLVCLEYSSKVNILKARCKRCNWKIKFINRTHLFANSSYLTKRNSLGNFENINHDMFLLNICPKMSSML
jgi:hypothetical protein